MDPIVGIALPLAASPAAASPVGWSDIAGILPVVILILTGAAALIADCCGRRNQEIGAAARPKTYLQVLSLLGTAAAFAAASAQLWAADPAPRAYFLDAVQVDPFSIAMALLILLGTLLAIAGSPDALRSFHVECGEFYALLLVGAASMILFVHSASLPLLFLTLETFSLAVYVLSAWRRDDRRSVEAGFKYFILGTFSSAFLLLGLVFVFGATQRTGLVEIARALRESPATIDRPLVLGGLGLLGAGLLFKVGAFPFHAWLPDAYEGAPAAVTAYMSVTVKVASLAVLFRVASLFAGSTDLGMGHAMIPFLSALAVATMVFGNVVAILQTSFKRMLAYSAIAHTGYLLVGVVAATEGKLHPGTFGEQDPTGAPLLFYLFAYALTSLGAFLAISRLARGAREPETFEEYAGLGRRDPLFAAAILILMLSLAGIPPTAGFWAKLYVFRQAIDSGHWGLALVGVLTSAVSVYYYLRILSSMYIQAEREESVAPLPEARSSAVVVGACAAATLVVGLLPDLIFRLSAACATP